VERPAADPLFAAFILLPVTLHLTGIAQTTARDEAQPMCGRSCRR
jgi:hypothetical protein